MAKRKSFFLSTVSLLILFLLALKGVQIADRALRAQAEARRLVGLALTGSRAPDAEAALYRRARELDPAHDRSGCERGRALERQGQWAAAADSFLACIDADPEEPYSHYAYAMALSDAYGPKSSHEALTELRRFAELAESSSTAIDPAIRYEAKTLLFDLEDLQGQDAGAVQNRYTEEEILKILTRSQQERGHSRYEGPRLPLRLAFRPGDAELGTAGEEQLREVARALRNGLLAKARIRIEGYTDSFEGGSRAARLALSQQRSEAVRDFLVHRCGIPGARLIVSGLGDRYTIASNETEKGQAANRRVELVNLEDKEPVWGDVRVGR